MSDVGEIRKMTVIAQDPQVCVGSGKKRRILTTVLTIPREDLGPGPQGYRVMVVDYDASRRVLYEAATFTDEDKFAKASDRTLRENAKFHAQNVYAIVMWLLARFEFALGRRVSWGFGGHQLYVAPHAFYEPNAYYSEDARGLLFGYFHGKSDNLVYTCLSHDIIAHETAHALLDGLRDSYTFPCGLDQAAFHEGLADAIALLSVFARQETVEAILREVGGVSGDRVPVTALERGRLGTSALAKFAEQFGEETGSLPGQALRNAVTRPPPKEALETGKYEECHLRGEILTAAMIHAFLAVWEKRLATWIHDVTDPKRTKTVSLKRAAEDGVDAADHLLTMAIRALDYCPVIGISFGDFLSALLTADLETVPDDSKYGYRQRLVEEFARWRIKPASHGRNLPADLRLPETGVWERPEDSEKLDYTGVHRESLQRDADEVFRFIWENRKTLRIFDRAYTRVMSVRPCLRVGPDGFALRETVCEYLQVHNLRAGRLWQELRIKKPRGMDADTSIRVRGGGVLVFDEFGRLKYHVRSRLNNSEQQQAHLDYLWDNGIKDQRGRYGITDGTPAGQRFALMHRRRAGRPEGGSEWDE